jgi:hypothetical protein
MEVDISTAEGKLIKKSIKESNAEDQTQILTKLTAFSNFLDTLKNWCKTTTGSEWYISKIFRKERKNFIY